MLKRCAFWGHNQPYIENSFKILCALFLEKRMIPVNGQSPPGQSPPVRSPLGFGHPGQTPTPDEMPYAVKSPPRSNAPTLKMFLSI